MSTLFFNINHKAAYYTKTAKWIFCFHFAVYYRNIFYLYLFFIMQPDLYYW